MARITCAVLLGLTSMALAHLVGLEVLGKVKQVGVYPAPIQVPT